MCSSVAEIAETELAEGYHMYCAKCADVQRYQTMRTGLIFISIVLILWLISSECFEIDGRMSPVQSKNIINVVRAKFMAQEKGTVRKLGRNVKASRHKSKKNKRQTIIKCCGRKTCTLFSSQKQNETRRNHTLKNEGTAQHQSTARFSFKQKSTTITSQSLETEMNSETQKATEGPQPEETFETTTETFEQTSNGEQSFTALSTDIIDIPISTQDTPSTTTTTVPSTATSTTQPPCSCPKNCDLQKNLTDPDNQIIDPEVYGEWKKIGNITFLFGDQPMVWLSAWQQCCSLGMKPISFESFQKLSSVGEIFKNWSNNLKFWTSGTSMGCISGTFVWCASDNRNFENGMWHSKQPAEKQVSGDVCISASFENGAFLLRDQLCSKRFAFACEGLMENPGEFLQNGCPASVHCDSSAKELTSNGLTQEPGPIRGTFQTKCGKLYYFSRVKKTWANARNYCCSIGMDLDSLYLIEKAQCIAEIFRNLPTRLNETTSYWSSGRATKYPGKHFWCSADLYFYHHEIVWGYGFPKKEHDCVFVSFNKTTNSTELGTAPCEEEKFFLCSAVSYNNTDKFKIWYECKETYGLYKDEEDLLLMFTTNMPANHLLCYARCLAQNFGKFLDKMTKGKTILRLLEDALKNETDLQVAYAGYEKCTSIKNDNRCDIAYLMLRCSLTTNYQMVQYLIAYILKTANNNNYFPSPLMCEPNYQYCDVNYICANNSTLINQLHSTGTSDIGKLVSLSNGAKYFVGRNINNSFSKLSYEVTYSYCCSIGMRLLEVENITELEELLLLDPTLRPEIWTTVGPIKENENGDLSFWCSSGAKIPETLFPMKKTPTDPCFKTSKCLFLQLMSGNMAPENSLHYSDCETTDVQFFLCNK
ncbi:uncharacterized protein LOC132194560 isoform X2 [Neocloeon triangulifer]|uniref:uncharacterized protein LOC132194560 isoform X2 n=1 Tax=Neocloeon triangulifer TaxID=2078957 RepID=UPI00286EE2F8|nr:uncharacterized protein LOC132194560 isoform X2 [Neocloeon triangulifer]